MWFSFKNHGYIRVEYEEWDKVSLLLFLHLLIRPELVFFIIIYGNRTYEFCTGDLAAIRISQSNDRYIGDVVLCSAYLPYDSSSLPHIPELVKLINFCNNQKLPIIIKCDAYSHHTVWGSTKCNSRGDALLGYIVGTDLMILNRGSVPTFKNIRRQEVIDITLASGILKPYINQSLEGLWRIHHTRS